MSGSLSKDALELLDSDTNKLRRVDHEETVYEGEVEHRDFSGGGGKIGRGEVQWMPAVSGIVHEDFRGAEYAKRGGPFEMVQLWVNLPKKHKTDPARLLEIGTEKAKK